MTESADKEAEVATKFFSLPAVTLWADNPADVTAFALILDAITEFADNEAEVATKFLSFPAVTL
jgi:hypothetical protein